MKIRLKESSDMVDCTEICCYTEDYIQLTTEIFLGVGLLNDPFLLRHCIKTALERAGIILGDELDDIAKRLDSSVELVTDGIYRIVDFLNCPTEDFNSETAKKMYFKRIANSGVCGGLYRQLSGNEIWS